MNAASVSGEQLKAGIQHFDSSIDNMEIGDIQASKSVRPLDKQLWSGNAFDRDSAERALKDAQPPSNFWYRVPTWLAGRWESADATTFFMRDHQSGKIDNSRTPYPFRGRESIGHQYDNQHRIWTYCRDYAWTRGRSSDSEVQSLLFYQHPLRVTQNEAIVLGRMAVFEVNAKGKITSSYKTEIIDTMSLQDEDTMRDEQIKIVFNEQGKPVTTIKTEVFWKRIADFQPIDEVKGVQLKPLFKSFLREHGMAGFADADQ
ncbi:MAG TPA: hypothetical protein V6C76_07125 [Drouetiella sp.]